MPDDDDHMPDRYEVRIKGNPVPERYDDRDSAKERAKLEKQKDRSQHVSIYDRVNKDNEPIE